MKIRILLADDHRIFREGLRSLIEKLPGMTVLGEAADGRTAVRLCGELNPSLVIMDLTMPDLNGIDSTRRIVEAHPHVKVLVLSMHADRRYVTEVLKAGAQGFLLKNNAFEELARAIQSVIAGQVYLSPEIAGVVVDNFRRSPGAQSEQTQGSLSERQREVVQLLAEGRTAKEIAASLKLSSKTVETHRRQIMAKLGLQSVAELTRYAIREGITPL